MSDAATLEYYQKQARIYADSFGLEPSRHLDIFLDLLEPGARILELGCGGGRDSLHIASRGFDSDPTDGTPAMVETARERTNLPVRLMRFDQITGEAEYDAVWAQACLLHVARADLPSVLSAIHRVLRPGGRHYASYKLGDGEGRDLLGRLTNLPDASWLEEIYRNAGFTIEQTEQYPGKGADGTMRDWCALTVRKPQHS